MTVLLHVAPGSRSLVEGPTFHMCLLSSSLITLVMEAVNISEGVPNYTAQEPRRQSPSCSPPSEPEILPIRLCCFIVNVDCYVHGLIFKKYILALQVNICTR
jgi:hypothetical protein